MKLHPQNETPGDLGPAPSIDPVTTGEILHVLDLILLGLKTDNQGFYAIASNRLDHLIKRS